MARSELSAFLPYLLNRAAELVSREFQPYYKERYGMLRTEWRVLFHLGRQGELTAKQICEQAALHKTKVSRAVTALEAKRLLERRPVETDRRSEALRLTKSGRAAFADLSQRAAHFDRTIETELGGAETAALKTMLLKLIADRAEDG